MSKERGTRTVSVSNSERNAPHNAEYSRRIKLINAKLGYWGFPTKAKRGCAPEERLKHVVRECYAGRRAVGPHVYHYTPVKYDGYRDGNHYFIVMDVETGEVLRHPKTASSIKRGAVADLNTIEDNVEWFNQSDYGKAGAVLVDHYPDTAMTADGKKGSTYRVFEFQMPGSPYTRSALLSHLKQGVPSVDRLTQDELYSIVYSSLVRSNGYWIGMFGIHMLGGDPDNDVVVCFADRYQNAPWPKWKSEIPTGAHDVIYPQWVAVVPTKYALDVEGIMKARVRDAGAYAGYIAEINKGGADRPSGETYILDKVDFTDPNSLLELVDADKDETFVRIVGFRGDESLSQLIKR